MNATSHLILGCGYLGSRVLDHWLAAGEAVHVVTRRAERADALATRGARPILGDVTEPLSLAKLPAADTVLFAVGFDRARYDSIHEVYVEGLAATLDALPEETGRIIYISSTGIYGQNDGSLVDEDSPTEPVRDGGRAVLAAEQILNAHPRGADAVILRLAGIYGSGRVPRREDLMKGEPLPPPADGYLNLIHVDDAARVVVAATSPLVASGTYLIADGTPTSRRDFYEEYARLVGAPAPTFAEETSDTAPKPRGTSSKRIDNSRMVEQLGVQLTYPSFREGLAAIVAADGQID